MNIASLNLRTASQRARADQVLASITKFGAATVLDVAADLDLVAETARRYVRILMEANYLVCLEAATTHICAIYAPADEVDVPEVDQHRTIGPAVQVGMARMDCVAALFGPAGAGDNA